MLQPLTPFKVDISNEVLDDLKNRLRNTRWADDVNNDDAYYGIRTDYLKELVDYWLNNYDWKKVEGELNKHTQYRVDIEGQPIHFIYQKSKHPNATPVILSHGWPWTYWHWSKVIEPLTDPTAYGGRAEDAFDVIIPSLPGFGFSTPVKEGSMNFSRMADLWHKLMTETLGFTKYAAVGSDYGALITAQLGHKYADELIGIVLAQELVLTIFQSERPWDLTEGALVPDDAPAEVRDALIDFQRTFASHVAVHMLDAQTLTHGLNDSPVGLLAWILQRWKKWSDKNATFESMYSKEDIITFAMIYWLNQAIGSSIRIYANAARYPWKPSHSKTPVVQAPTGFVFLAGEKFPPMSTVDNRVGLFKDGPLAAHFNTVYTRAFAKGGHFSPWENPEDFTTGIRETFDLLKTK
jgi:pimeloyl-ACP methyl ester carboxylesterase